MSAESESGKDKPLAKIFTATRDDYDMIEDFVAHHGRLFGYENIILLDCGSVNERVLAAYEEFRARGVEIVKATSSVGEEDQELNLTQVMAERKNSAEFLIRLDSNEFLYSSGARACGQNPIDPAIVAATLRALPADAALFEIAEYPCSKPDPSSPAYKEGRIERPAVNITTFVTNDRFGPHKVFFRAAAFGETEKEKPVVAPIGYLHFYNTGSAHSFERAQKMMKAYFNVDQPVSALVTETATLQVPQGQAFFQEFRHVILRKYLFELFVELIRRLPSEREMFNHVNLWWKSSASSVRKSFEDCEERKTALTRPELEPEATKLAFSRIVFPDSFLGGAEMRCRFLSRSLAPTTNKKAALAFSGHVRTFLLRKKEWAGFLERLRSAGIECDVFFHTWNSNCRVRDVNGLRKEGQYQEHALEGLMDVIETLKPKAFKIEESVPSSLPAPSRAILLQGQGAKANIASQLFSIREGYRLVEEHENKHDFKYDCVARFRFDYNPALQGAKDFLLASQSDHSDVIFINAPPCHMHPGGGGGCLKCDAAYRIWRQGGPKESGCKTHTNDICDIFAVGAREPMRRYMTALDYIGCHYNLDSFHKSLRKMKEGGLKIVPCPIAGGPNGDVRYHYHPLNVGTIEKLDIHGFYPERLHRLNLSGYRVVHASIGFHLDCF